MASEVEQSLEILKQFLKKQVPMLMRDADDAEYEDDLAGYGPYELALNPHIWANPSDQRKNVYKNSESRWSCEWASSDWPVLTAFLQKHTPLRESNLKIGFHGAKNSYRVSCILKEGLRISGGGCSYFGETPEDCRQYAHDAGSIVIFVLVRDACSGTRGDGAFSAQSSAALPVGTFQKDSNWRFKDLFCK